MAQTDGLISRLAKGQEMLVTKYAEYHLALDLWEKLEGELRETGYKGCIFGSVGCDPQAPVCCSACADYSLTPGGNPHEQASTDEADTQALPTVRG